MTKSTTFLYTGSAALVVLLSLGALYVLAQGKSGHIEIEWVIGHEPIGLFDNAKEVFEKEFAKHSDKTIEVTLLGPKDFGSATDNLYLSEVMRYLDSGQAQVATVVVRGLRTKDPELSILTMPYLFSDYPTAIQFLDSEAGDQLLATVHAYMPAHALAFTLSGGLMGIQSNTQVFKSPADFRGKRIGTIRGDTAAEIFRSLEATPVLYDPKDGAETSKELLDTLDGVEVPYTRIVPEKSRPAYMTETDHSLLLTSIIVSDAFYGSLSAEDQTALRNAAKAAAVVEREASLALGESTKAKLQQLGTVITTLSGAEKAVLATKTISVYDVFAEYISVPILQAARDIAQKDGR